MAIKKTDRVLKQSIEVQNYSEMVD